MARAYLASTSTSSTSTLTTTTVPLSTPTLASSIAYKTPASFLDRVHPYLLATPFAALFDLRPADARRHGLNKGSERHNARMDLSIGPGAHWLSRLRSCLRLLIIVLSGAVVCMLMHTFEIYRGNRYLDLRRGELPMTWPAHTNLAPTIILFVVAAANFLASVAILTLSFKRSFRRPFRSRDIYRIVAGSFSVIMWLTALVAFNLLDKASKASLGRYSCTNASIPSNGRYQYRAVCEEQGVAFYTAMGAAFAETITLVTLAISAILSVKHPEPQPTIRIREKNNSISSGSKFLKPIKRATP